MSNTHDPLSSSLTEPLLVVPSENTNNKNNNKMIKTSNKWPTETAKRAKLYIPKDYGYNDDDGEFESTCFIRYDNERNLLFVVSTDDEEEILDVIDPNDIIGASIEIKLFHSDPHHPLCSSLTAPPPMRELTFQNSTTKEEGEENDDEDDEGIAAIGKCGIFKPLNDDTEKIFMSCNNEPISDVPFDTQAIAILNIFVYPRLDSSQLSFLNWCGITEYKPRPNIPTTTTTTTNTTTTTTTTTTSTTPTSNKTLGHRYGYPRRFQVAPAEDFSDISTLVRAIRQVSRSSEHPPQQGSSEQEEDDEQEQMKKFLIVVNPRSGRKQGEKDCKTIVSPMLEQAGIDHDVVITNYARHAEELAKQQQQEENDDSANGSTSNDLSKYDAVICIGGDGIVHELLQGIKSRPDMDQLLKKVKFGIIGSGTANGLAKSIAHASKELCSPIDSTFLICKGKTSWMDISKYHSPSRDYLSFLTFSWSIIADIDIESEVLRFLGSTRFDVWAVWRVAFLRQYKARLSYLPQSSSKTSDTDKSNDNKNGTKTSMPSLSDPIPNENWVTVEDNFYLFWASHVTHAGENTFHSPSCKLDDGVFTIFMVRGSISRYRMAMILLGLENGTHIHMPGVEFITCVAYRLEPLEPGSFNDLDGEVVESGTIQGQVLPSAMQVFCDRKD